MEGQMSSISDIPIPAAYTWEEEELQGIVIEKNIPVPRGGGKWGKLLLRLDVGDSILIPTKDKIDLHNKQNMILCRVKGLDISIITRTVSDGLRVWRTK